MYCYFMMGRRHFWGGALGLLLLTASLSAVAQGLPAAPNIIYILADDLGYGDVSAYNDRGR